MHSNSNSNESITEVFRLLTLWRLIMLMISLIILFGVIAHWIEPNIFPSFFDGIWWAIVTTFTVGYGDLVPESILGRANAILLILLGTGFGSYYMISFATEMVSRQYTRQQGSATVSFSNHLIIVGWNERVKLLLQQYKQLHPKHKVVLVDETLPNLPREYSYLFFIKGCPYQDATLNRANAAAAHTIVITADQEKDESSTDTLTVLTILTAKGINPSLHCIAEILTEQQVDNAKRAGANEIVQTNKFISHILTTSLHLPNASETFISLCNQSLNTSIRLLAVDSEPNETFHDSCCRLLEENILLLGVKRAGKDYINPPHPFPLKQNDMLIVITR